MRAGRLTQEQQVGCFVSGLKENIKTDVQACKPQTLSAAIGLARMYESQNQTGRRVPILDVKKFPPTGVMNFEKRRNPMSIKQLSSTELRERREKGLFYNCDKNFSLGHRCKKLFLIEGCWSNEDKEEEAIAGIDVSEDAMPEVFLHAIYGGRAL